MSTQSFNHHRAMPDGLRLRLLPCATAFGAAVNPGGSASVNGGFDTVLAARWPFAVAASV